MSLVTRLRKSIAEAREQENMKAALDKQQALIEFLAIMADVDIDIDEEGHITLLEKGLKIADKIYERHLILTDYFTKIGVSPETAEEDACRIEHVISDETFNKIKEDMKTR